MRRLLPTLLTALAFAVVLGVAGVEAWRTAAAHGWLDDGFDRLVRDAFWHRFDRTAPLALGVLLAALAGTAVLGRRAPSRAALAGPLVIVILLVLARGAALVDAASCPRRPNVVLISIDTLRADRVGAYGYPRPTSPAVDARLAAEGVVFEDAWAPSPKTTPSHLTMLTSLLPGAHGVGLWEGRGAAPALNPRVHTLAEILRNAGYATAAFTAGAHMHRDRGFGQGFDVYKHGRQLERTLEWLRARPRRPFFLFFHTYEVHDPYTPPPDLIDAFAADPVPPIADAVAAIRGGTAGWGQGHKRFWASVDGRDPRHVRFVSDLYDAGIRRMDDRTLAQILDALDALGIADQTLVVFTSDHGEAFQEHGRFLHDDLHAETLRVPLVLRFPSRLPAGRRVPDAVSLLDLVPTVLDLLILPIPAQAQGTSLAPLALQADDATAPGAVVAEHGPPGRRLESIRQGGLALLRDPGGVRVYDRRADPAERRPLRVDQVGGAAALVAALDGVAAENARVAARLGPRATDAAAPSAATVEHLRALGYVE